MWEPRQSGDEDRQGYLDVGVPSEGLVVVCIEFDQKNGAEASSMCHQTCQVHVPSMDTAVNVVKHCIWFVSADISVNCSAAARICKNGSGLWVHTTSLRWVAVKGFTQPDIPRMGVCVCLLDERHCCLFTCRSSKNYLYCTHTRITWECFPIHKKQLFISLVMFYTLVACFQLTAIDVHDRYSRQ